MDPVKIAPCCNCCQPFHIVALANPPKGRFPRTLKCGHSICDKCLFTSFYDRQGIKCNDCQFVSEISQADIKMVKDNSDTLKHLFPVNVFILGQLTYNNFFTSVNSNNFRNVPHQNPNLIPAGMRNFPIHKNQRYNNQQLMFNQYRNTQDFDRFLGTLSVCKEHEGKQFEFFCKTCDKCICSFCLVKTCSGHNFILVQEIDKNFKNKIIEGKKATKDLQLRIGNTIKQLEKKRFSIMFGSVDTKPVETNIANRFSKLYGKLMLTERKLLKQVIDCKNSFENFMQGLKDSMEMLMNLNAAADYALQNEGKANLPSLLAALQSAVETPWYLEDNATPLSPSIELEIDEELELNLENYCKIKMDSAKLKLLATSELPSYMELPPPPPADDTPDTASQKSSTSDSMSCLHFQELDFELRPKTSRDQFHPTQQVSFVKPLPAVKAENNEKPIKPLAPGMEERVLVTHVNNPHDFYIQRCIAQPKLQELTESFNQIRESLLAPEPDAIKPDATFVIYDNTIKWTRVTIVDSENNNDETCLVKYLDYGHTGIVATRRLRVINNPTPPFAINCRLVDCEPIGSETWSEDITKLMYKIICRGNGICTLVVSDKRNDTFHVDLISIPTRRDENQTSLKEALVFLGHAQLTKKVNNKVNRQSKNAHFMQNNTMQHFYRPRLSDVEDVIVTAILNPSVFFVRKECTKNYFKDLTDQLNSYYSCENEIGIIYSPTEGMCVACFVNNMWWRARIVQLKPKSELLVILVDVGTQHIVPWDHVRKLIPKFFKSEELAAECKLAHVKLESGNFWSEKAIEFMKSTVEIDSVCRLSVLQIAKKKNGPFTHAMVLLYKKDEEGDEICFNSLLVKEGFALEQGKLPSLKKVTPAISRQLQKTTPAGPSVSDTPKTGQDKGPMRLEVGILSARSPSEIYITLKSEESEEELKKMYAEMQKSYKTSKPDQSCKWNSGDKCAVLSTKKNKWCRAIIDNVDEQTNKVNVFLKDFGCSEEVTVNDIRPLAQRFLNVADGALKCHLSGIAPASGDKWPMLTCESLQEMIEEYDKFYITKDGDIVDKSLPIELWIYHITPGGALTPTIREFKKINDRIIENGLAVPSRILKKKDEAEVASAQSEEKVENSLSTESINFDINPPVTITNWLPAPPLKHKEFVGVCTNVDDNLDIFLYDMEENSSNLDLLSNFLTNYFTDSKPKPYDLFWFKGQICITKYDVDNKYYRAEVIEIVQENNMALVRFIDYGNTQTCPISSLRKDIVMENIPIQNYRCKLHGIKPAKGNKWDQNIGDLVHQTVVDKKSLITVVGEPDEDGVIPIRLKVNMSHDLADLLISLKYAVAYVAPKITLEPPPQAEVVDDGPDIIVEEEIPMCTLPMKHRGPLDWSAVSDEGE